MPSKTTEKKEVIVKKNAENYIYPQILKVGVHG